MAAPAPPLPAGEVLASKYRVIGHIGSGGMASVYRAEHLRLGQHVAVKVLAPELAVRPDFAARFEREARAAGLVRSIHAVRVHDVDALADGTPFLVMELLEGNDLHRESALRDIPFDELAAWILQVCAAIGEAHTHGIVHRDLKPGNIFLASVERARIAKVLDFGLSSVRGERKLTVRGQTVGTLQYMAPEQLRGQEVEGRTDVYALGVLLYKLLSKRFPFQPQEMLAYATGTGKPPTPLAELRPDLPRGFVALVMQAMSRSPEGRPKLEELAAGLAPYAADGGALSLRGTPIAGASRGVQETLADARESSPDDAEAELSTETMTVPRALPEAETAERTAVDLPAAGAAHGRNAGAEAEEPTEPAMEAAPAPAPASGDVAVSEEAATAQYARPPPVRRMTPRMMPAVRATRSEPSAPPGAISPYAPTLVAPVVPMPPEPSEASIARRALAAQAATVPALHRQRSEALARVRARRVWLIVAMATSVFLFVAAAVALARCVR